MKPLLKSVEYHTDERGIYKVLPIGTYVVLNSDKLGDTYSTYKGAFEEFGIINKAKNLQKEQTYHIQLSNNFFKFKEETFLIKNYLLHESLEEILMLLESVVKPNHYIVMGYTGIKNKSAKVSLRKPNYLLMYNAYGREIMKNRTIIRGIKKIKPTTSI